MNPGCLLIGLDFSTNPSKRKAYAISFLNKKYKRQCKLELSGLNNKDLSDRILGLSSEWNEIVLAIDSPMGWPVNMIQDLRDHKAGDKLLNNQLLRRQDYFRRVTDHFIKERLKKTPFSVGADKIAAMAFDVLEIMGEIKSEFQLDVGYGVDTRHKVIEVYPGATIVERLNNENTIGYKKNINIRDEMYNSFTKVYNRLNINDLFRKEEVLQTDDDFDAFICLLAAVDYNEGRLCSPQKGRIISNIIIEKEKILKEGWIWAILKDNAHNTG